MGKGESAYLSATCSGVCLFGEFVIHLQKSITKLDMDTIEDYLAKDDDRYEALFRQIENLKPSNPIKLNFPEPMAELIFSDEQLDKDPKLAYLVNKHLR